MSRAYNSNVHSNIVTFMTSTQYSSAIVLSMDHVLDLVLSIDILFKSNGSLTIGVQNRETKKTVYVHYIIADLLLSIQVCYLYFNKILN